LENKVLFHGSHLRQRLPAGAMVADERVGAVAVALAAVGAVAIGLFAAGAVAIGLTAMGTVTAGLAVSPRSPGDLTPSGNHPRTEDVARVARMSGCSMVEYEGAAGVHRLVMAIRTVNRSSQCSVSAMSACPLVTYPSNRCHHS
jgi:hypothetical protein